MKCKTQTIPILLTALFLVISLSIVGFSVAGNEITETNGFLLEDWSIDQELVQPGEEVIIEGSITNLGEDGDDEYVILFVDGEEKNRTDPFVGPGESKQISFSHYEDEEGDYTVSVELGSSDDSWDEGEFRVELVTHVEITPDTNRTIKAGEDIDFSAKAYSGEDDEDPTTDDSIFTWKNTDENGLFDKREAGEYKINATYNDVSSDTIVVTVEPADPEILIFIQTPVENTIMAGDTAEFTVQVQDGFGNVQTSDSFHVALEVDGERRHSTYIEDGESTATLDWSTTAGRQGNFNVEAIEIENNALDTAEVTLTVNEREESSILAGQWWIFPLALVFIGVISVVYLADTSRKGLNLDILGNLGKKKKPTTHEWKRNKESEEINDGEIEPSD